MKLVPYVVVRSNNISLDELELLTCSARIEVLSKEIEVLRDELVELRDEVCAHLYSLAAVDAQRYRELIDLKRRIFKEAPPTDILARHAVLMATLPELGPWLEKARQLLCLQAERAELFESELAQARCNARRLAQDEHFRHAIAFTRGNIGDAVRDYAAQAEISGKKALNDEETIYRYLLRAVTKASPFSTFTSIGFAPLRRDANGHVKRSAPLQHRYGYDRATLLKIYDRFVLRHRKFWRFRLTRNRVDAADQQYAYLFMDRADTYPYRTSFAKTVLPKAQQQLFVSGADGWVCWEDLEARLPPSVNVQALLEKWLTSGMVGYDPPLEDQSPDPVTDFRRIAQSVAALDAAARPVVDLLLRIEELHAALGSADVEQTALLADGINATFHTLAAELGYRMIKASGLLYHDSYLPNLGEIGATAIERFSTQAEEFLHGYLACNFSNDLSAELLQQLRAAISSDAPVDIFTFNEAVQRCFANRPAAAPSAAMSPLLSLYDEVWQRRGETEIELEPRPLPAGHRRHSFCVYGHLLEDGFVVNNLDSGYLRCLSRFFTFTEDHEILERCRAAYGAELADAHEFYETFGFNTGRRPRLCGGRIHLDAAGSAESDLALSDLQAVWPANAPQPLLCNRRTGRQVQLRHTALFVTSLYPRPLENLLRLASSEDPCYFAFRFGLHKLVTDRGEGAIVCIPRIRYRDLILSRRQWWIPRRELPQRLAGETAMGCFLKLDAWRRKLGLPQRVFVRRHSLDKVLERDISNNKKPLFIDFSSPIMSRMIGRVLNSDFDYLSLEEALPDHRQRFVSDARCSYASEIIFEQAGDSARSHAH